MSNNIPWYERHKVAIRNLIISILLCLLAILGYDQAVAQPRLEEIQNTSRGATIARSRDGANLTYCQEDAPCIQIRVR